MSDTCNTPIIILMQPQLGENIGMVARAMKNCGFYQLRIIDPRDGWPNPDAISASAGADDILQHARITQNLEEAIDDCHYVLGLTARPRMRALPRFDLTQAVTQTSQKQQQNLQSALLFGAERSGLDNDAISRCDGLIHIALNPDFQSLNLSQAVLLFCYLYWQNHLLSAETDGITTEHITADNIIPAPRDELHNFLQRLETSLERRGFFKTEQQKPEIIRNLRSYFTRSSPTDQELRTLHGIIERLKKPHTS
ncbi:MAG: RNA methyltransferase [Alphaproteobacteria bacterium]|nr:RNA methyltransferase [Alphaproteobacteria bacterium]